MAALGLGFQFLFTTISWAPALAGTMKEVLSRAKVGDKLEGEGVHGDISGMGAGVVRWW